MKRLFYIAVAGSSQRRPPFKNKQNKHDELHLSLRPGHRPGSFRSQSRSLPHSHRLRQNRPANHPHFTRSDARLAPAPEQRQRGSGHHTAVRALAYKWQRIIWKCWSTRTPYKEETYEACLQKNGSPIVMLFDQIKIGKSPVKITPKKSNKPLVGLPQRRTEPRGPTTQENLRLSENRARSSALAVSRSDSSLLLFWSPARG